MPQRGINAGTPVRYTVDGVDVNTIWQEVIAGLEVLNEPLPLARRR
ncbi:hypothetical protein SAMN06264364_13459 [Quadrisphaera granulorum]|uniref:Uncharacterized protein n=1 Tax=Quadrisphaera granulorum TaxID=317664 RepID=A0A315ZT27_9ACTN|nr:hypothetical protein [Quadrisphaera granulorum]PWJ47884.1 hypothetical protein BXY45_13459 [Quadrisphaera granulorum]SZE98651.1 hypothetical protein SAMN06264364_13459 [Quadrisphaera granulorum]